MSRAKLRRRFRRHAWAIFGGADAASPVSGLVNALWIEPRRIKVNRLQISLPHLPRRWDGLRIAHLTDLHHGRLVRLGLIAEAVRLANAESPDMVVLTGDFVSRAAAINRELSAVLAELEAPLGVYAVLGNHDHWTDAAAVRRMLADANVRLLENQHVLLARGRDELAVAGVGDYWSGLPHVETALRGVPERAGRVLLCHNPRYARKIAPDPRVDVMLSGHTHGRQFRLPYTRRARPILRRVLTGSGLMLGPHFPVYVSRGIGMVGLPVRVNCRPELPIVTLRRAAP